MSYGFDLGNIQSDSIGLSYVDAFDYTVGTVTKTYTFPLGCPVTQVNIYLTPSYTLDAENVVEYPTVTHTLVDNVLTVVATSTHTYQGIKIMVLVR